MFAKPFFNLTPFQELDEVVDFLPGKVREKVAQAGENPQVFRLPIALSEHLPLSLEALRNRFLASDEAETEVAPEDDSGLEFDFDPETLDALLEKGAAGE